LDRWIDEQAGKWQLTTFPLKAGNFYDTTELVDLHKDPFDRLLIAQALTEGLAVDTADRRFAEYAIEVVYAG